MSVDIPVISSDAFLKTDGRNGQEDCEAVAQGLERTGLVVVRDPRLPADVPGRFLDLMTRYFGQSEDLKREDMRAEIGYQVGWTPSFIERPKPRPEVQSKLRIEHKPHRTVGSDPKERFFASLGKRPSQTKFGWLNANPVMPRAFPEWADITGEWSRSMLSAVHTLLEMAAVGFGERADLFTSLLEYGPHLLAPTGSDLSKYGAPGTVLAGFHDDLNLVTAHTQSNYPGLRAWTRSGESFFAKVPPGCILFQAGQQLEYVTGGVVLCGLHEVVAVDTALPKIRAELAEGRVPWRISSTLFATTSSDATLKPLGSFATDEALQAYPDILAGDQVAKELKTIELVRD